MLTYLETIDQVISGKKLIEDKFQSVVSTTIIQRKYIERPHVHVLQKTHVSFISTSIRQDCIVSVDWYDA